MLNECYIGKSKKKFKGYKYNIKKKCGIISKKNLSCWCFMLHQEKETKKNKLTSRHSYQIKVQIRDDMKHIMYGDQEIDEIEAFKVINSIQK